MHRGFTLIELLIVIAIGAILATIAAPSLRDTLNNMQQSSALGLVISDLNQARGEAIKRNLRVLMCVRNAAGTDCSAGTDWRVGWLVCGESAVANQCALSTADNPNPVIVRPALATNLTFGATDAVPAAIAVIRFNPNSSQGAGGGAATLTLAGTWSGATARTVVVQGSGNISKQ